MKIAVLTSSRADYGIYRPFLKRLHEDAFFDLSLIVFGTHLSPFHGYTVSQIEIDQFPIDHKVETTMAGDTESSISTSMSLTAMKFAAIWEKEKHNYNIVLCLGDRYEMFAAVAAGLPFNIRFAHIHAGETTLGAIDNALRHSISLFSTWHFTATEQYAQRVYAITHQNNNIYNVGALSLDNLLDFNLYTPEEFQSVFSINVSIPYVLVTIHPETINPAHTQQQSKEFYDALAAIPHQVIVTMPNADTHGSIIREMLRKLQKIKKDLILVENFGSRGYFSCMKHALMLIGNTSSGIIEAASFNKYVINTGNRQEGRAAGQNIIHTPINKSSILEAYHSILKDPVYNGPNIYYRQNVAISIIKILKGLLT